MKSIKWRGVCFGFSVLLLTWLPMHVAGMDLLPVEGQPAIRPATRAITETPETAEPGARIRIASYNIQDFFMGTENGHRKREHMERQALIAARIIDEIDPDILLLQEMQNGVMVSYLNEHLEKPYPVGYVTKLGTAENPLRLNLAVLSRFPLAEASEIDFSGMDGPGRPTRGAMRFDVALDEEASLRIYNVHLKANWGNQLRNISQRHNALSLLLQDWAEWERARDPDRVWEVMIGGDFNVDPDHPSFAGDISLQPLDHLIDLWEDRPLEERITVPTRYGAPNLEFPAVAFDRFYVANGFRDTKWILGQPHVLAKGVNIEDNQMQAGYDETTASDHYPIFIDLYRSVPPTADSP
jgi:endonuclease/exonuclease/phosphatase family metal-dependent hydrolase